GHLCAEALLLHRRQRRVGGVADAGQGDGGRFGGGNGPRKGPAGGQGGGGAGDGGGGWGGGRSGARWAAAGAGNNGGIVMGGPPWRRTGFSGSWSASRSRSPSSPARRACSGEASRRPCPAARAGSPSSPC